MGMRNINEAVCDRCGKTVRSSEKQADFLRALKHKGWKGSISTLTCPDCLKVPMMRLGQIKLIDGVYYVVVVAEEGSQDDIRYAFVPYEEFLTLGGSTLPSVTSPAFKDACSAKGIDVDRMRFPRTLLVWPPEWKRVASESGDGKPHSICVAHFR